MSKDSRPNDEQITQMMQLYDYHEKQAQLININCEDISKIADGGVKKQQTLSQQSTHRTNFTQLDTKYQQLGISSQNQESQCRKEEAERDQIFNDRNQRRTHYSNILSSIDHYRQEYEKVQNIIRNRQREFTQLATYFSARQAEENQILVELPAQSLQFQQSILQAQQQLTERAKILQNRLILAIQESQLSVSR